MEDWAEIRRLHRAEGMPIKAIVRKLGVVAERGAPGVGVGGSAEVRAAGEGVAGRCGRAADPASCWRRGRRCRRR